MACQTVCITRTTSPILNSISTYTGSTVSIIGTITRNTICIAGTTCPIQ